MIPAQTRTIRATEPAAQAFNQVKVFHCEGPAPILARLVSPDVKWRRLYPAEEAAS